MQWPDLVNGLFEAAGGFMVFMNCWRLHQDKVVKGVSVLATVVFTAWGFWNLWYYPHLQQWLSFVGGLLIVAGNVVWIAMVAHYRRAPRIVPFSRFRTRREQ
jgi:uncharacterized membrane protein YfcA